MTGFELIRAKLFLFLVGIGRRMTLGARAMLIEGNKVLLIRHTYVAGWQFPGGGVDAGETMENTMRREVFEETGFEVTGEVQLHGVFLNRQVSKRDHVAFYVVREFEQKKKFQANREIAQIGWFDVNELPEDITRSARERVAEVFGESGNSQFW